MVAVIYFQSHLPNISNTRCVLLSNGNFAGFRGLVYTLAKLTGDYNAVKKGKVGQRMGHRAAGKATGKAMRKLFK